MVASGRASACREFWTSLAPPRRIFETVEGPRWPPSWPEEVGRSSSDYFSGITNCSQTTSGRSRCEGVRPRTTVFSWNRPDLRPSSSLSRSESEASEVSLLCLIGPTATLRLWELAIWIDLVVESGHERSTGRFGVFAGVDRGVQRVGCHPSLEGTLGRGEGLPHRPMDESRRSIVGSWSTPLSTGCYGDIHSAHGLAREPVRAQLQRHARTVTGRTVLTLCRQGPGIAIPAPREGY